LLRGSAARPLRPCGRDPQAARFLRWS
jgi:hypothetical protein